MKHFHFVPRLCLRLLVAVPALACCLAGCSRRTGVIDLSGTWQLALSADTFVLDRPVLHEGYDDTVVLPGTLDENGKGTPSTDTTTMHLNRLYTYTGTAWYRTSVDIPASWAGCGAELLLERSKITAVWVDDVLAGTSTIVSAAQHYDLQQLLTPGRHLITVAVNNDPAQHTVGGSHAYTDHTLTNWNGILGRMEIAPYHAVRLIRLQTYPDAAERKVTVKLCLENQLDTLRNVRIDLRAEAWNVPEEHAMPDKHMTIDLAPGRNIVKLTCSMGEDALLWSDSHPALYRLEAEVKAPRQPVVRQSVHFGLRDFEAGEYHFTINGTPVFLRGKLESGTFPLLGYAPMDTASWLRYFNICRTYGINHVRFHSWTPPEAAFLAADMTGMYLQTELPNWADFTSENPRHTEWMLREGKAAMEDFGSHASFVMFTLGNEIAGEPEIAEQMVRDLRAFDPRRLYAFGANNFLNDPFFGRNDDFWVSFRTGREDADRKTDIRGSASCNEDLGSGIINSMPPSSSRNYDAAAEGFHMPIVGHEVGQYQMYPNYAEIEKYTGLLRAWNFEVFRDRLRKAGMADQADDFFRASGASLFMLYKEEMEMARRTAHFAGYQLLDLQDYPGQGTALVGLLDAFMDNKGIVSADSFRTVGGDVVPLICMDRFCWTWSDTLEADVKVSYFAPQQLPGATVRWTLDSGGTSVAAGTFFVEVFSPGELRTAGTIRLPLGGAVAGVKPDEAVRATLTVSIDGTEFRNSSPLWIYPAAAPVETPAGVTVTRRLDAATLQRLAQGGTVVFFPEAAAIEKQSVGPQFINDFWNWLMFKGICEDNNRTPSQGTLGLLLNPAHPLFAAFPTENHTEWQWWRIMMHARPFILDGTDASCRPVVQVIDNIDRNHKLGIVFEWKVGGGRLVVCTADLPRLLDSPETCQFYRALLRYAASDDCRPEAAITVPELQELF